MKKSSPQNAVVIQQVPIKSAKGRLCQIYDANLYFKKSILNVKTGQVSSACSCTNSQNRSEHRKYLRNIKDNIFFENS